MAHEHERDERRQPDCLGQRLRRARPRRARRRGRPCRGAGRPPTPCRARRPAPGRAHPATARAAGRWSSSTSSGLRPRIPRLRRYAGRAPRARPGRATARGGQRARRRSAPIATRSTSAGNARTSSAPTGKPGRAASMAGLRPSQSTDRLRRSPASTSTLTQAPRISSSATACAGVITAYSDGPASSAKPKPVADCRITASNSAAATTAIQPFSEAARAAAARAARAVGAPPRASRELLLDVRPPRRPVRARGRAACPGCGRAAPARAPRGT